MSSNHSRIPDWFKPKPYQHFSKKISLNDYFWLIKNLQSSSWIEKYSFYPLIRVELTSRKFRKIRDKETNQLSPIRVNLGNKVRPINYANHIDAHIYSFYSNSLSTVYEETIIGTTFDKSILAYRRILKEGTTNKHKSNIDFANDTFNEIKALDCECVAITLDVKDFFESLDHKLLKTFWCKLLQLKTLPPDHYKVYKSLIRYSYIESKDIIDELGLKHFKNLRLLKENCLCSPDVFRKRLSPHIKIHSTNKGIPQGTAISAFLSNLYMLDFDIQISNLVQSELKGIYRRYSDDIIIVVKPEQAKHVEEYTSNFLINNLGLEINASKTERILFKKNESGKLIACWVKGYEANELIYWNTNDIPHTRPLQYLGFTFDGEKKLVRNQSISKYHRNINQAIKIKARKAHKRFSKNPDCFFKIYRKSIYKHSHLYKRNYYNYILRASKIMDDENLYIRKQVRNHWELINRGISKRDLDI